MQAVHFKVEISCRAPVPPAERLSIVPPCLTRTGMHRFLSQMINANRKERTDRGSCCGVRNLQPHTQAHSLTHRLSLALRTVTQECERQGTCSLRFGLCLSLFSLSTSSTAAMIAVTVTTAAVAGSMLGSHARVCQRHRPRIWANSCGREGHEARQSVRGCLR